MLQTQEVMECRFRQPDSIACACTPTVLPLQNMTFKKIPTYTCVIVMKHNLTFYWPTDLCLF